MLLCRAGRKLAEPGNSGNSAFQGSTVLRLSPCDKLPRQLELDYGLERLDRLGDRLSRACDPLLEHSEWVRQRRLRGHGSCHCRSADQRAVHVREDSGGW